MNSTFHIVINDIRTKYSGKNVSIYDIYDIEETYKMCSIVNVRNDNCAFLRITFFGFDEVVFEDIVTNIELVKKYSTFDDLDYELKRILYGQAYGVVLVNDHKKYLDKDIHKPSFDFSTDKEEIKRLKKRCEDLEKELHESSDLYQSTLFD